jgi:hypothetical protein
MKTYNYDEHPASGECYDVAFWHPTSPKGLRMLNMAPERAKEAARKLRADRVCHSIYAQHCRRSVWWTPAQGEYTTTNDNDNH